MEAANAAQSGGTDESIRHWQTDDAKNVAKKACGEACARNPEAFDDGYDFGVAAGIARQGAAALMGGLGVRDFRKGSGQPKAGKPAQVKPPPRTQPKPASSAPGKNRSGNPAEAAEKARTQQHPHGKRDAEQQRKTPQNLEEQLTLEEAQAGAGVDARVANDPRYPKGTKKGHHSHRHADGRTTVVHYMERPDGTRGAFKFKPTPDRKGPITPKKGADDPGKHGN